MGNIALIRKQDGQTLLISFVFNGRTGSRGRENHYRSYTDEIRRIKTRGEHVYCHVI